MSVFESGIRMPRWPRMDGMRRQAALFFLTVLIGPALAEALPLTSELEKAVRPSVVQRTDPLFTDGFDLPVCQWTTAVRRVYHTGGESEFFEVSWQQRQYADVCGASAEMLRFEGAVCKRTEDDPIHPNRAICDANACCGQPRHDPSPCDKSAFMQNGSPVLPSEALDVQPAEDVDEVKGHLADLYPGQDTTNGDFRADLECEPSIGEQPLPADIDQPPSPADQAAIDAVQHYEQNEGAALAASATIGAPPHWFMSIGTPHCEKYIGRGWVVLPCDSGAFRHPDQPFEGRDVIYVHGLAVDHLKNWIGNYAPARKRWPGDQDEFTEPGGYFREYAKNYWKDHIREHLFDPDTLGNDPLGGWQWWTGNAEPIYRPKQNRVLIVAWPSGQRLEDGQDAFITQVYAAIESNQNVMTPVGFPADERRTFCATGCVIVSHSTGGLLVSSALGRIQRGEYGPNTSTLLPLLHAHVAFEGAHSGSRLAEAMLGVSRMTGGLGRARLCELFATMFQSNALCDHDPTVFLESSVLVDLMPAVAQGLWGPVLSASPTPTLTVVGANPVGNSDQLFGVTKLLLPGIDDSVASANSACGNPNPVHPYGLAPSGIIVKSLLKSFDLGDVGTRAVKNFISQKHLMHGVNPGGSHYLAGVCTPWLSPSGMVLPVASTLQGTSWDTRKRWPNYYSLLQSMAEHSYDGGSDDDNRWPSAQGRPATAQRHYMAWGWNNVEESSAITDSSVFQRYIGGSPLLNPAFADSVEIVRGKKIRFRLFRKNRVIWLWKRTYERLNGWETKQSSHYVYEYVLRG